MNRLKKFNWLFCFLFCFLITANVNNSEARLGVDSAWVKNTPAGNIAAGTTQAAVNELDSEKIAVDGSIAFTGNQSHGDNNITNVGDISLDSISADGTEITINGDTDIVLGASDNVTIDASTTSTTNTLGTLRINHIPDTEGTRAITIDIDANNKTDAMGIAVEYTATGISSGERSQAFDVTVDSANSTGGSTDALNIEKVGTGTVDVNALHISEGVIPIHHESGTFSAADNIEKTTNEIAFTAITTGSEMFSTDNDFVYFGHSTTYNSIEWLFNTIASGEGIKPEFYFSTGAGTWTQFYPNDSTNGCRTNGAVAWELVDISGTWALATYDSVSRYWIKIKRTQNALTTPPVLNTMKYASSTQYWWDENGNLTVNNVLPQANSLSNLGSDTYNWNDIYATGDIISKGTISITSKVNEAGGISVGNLVYISGASGDKPRVSLADNTVHDKAHIFGMATETKTDGQNIKIAISGEINSLNTSGLGAGNRLHLITGGGFQVAVPTSGAHIHVGFVTKDDVSEGIIELAFDPYVHDVRGTTDLDIKLSTGADDGTRKIIFENYSSTDLGFIDGSGLFQWDGNATIGSGDDTIIFKPSTGITIGSGAADVDYTITVDGETNDGVLTYDEDNDKWVFSEAVEISGILTSTSAIYSDRTGNGLLNFRGRDTGATNTDMISIYNTPKIMFGGGLVAPDSELNRRGTAHLGTEGIWTADGRTDAAGDNGMKMSIGSDLENAGVNELGYLGFNCYRNLSTDQWTAWDNTKSAGILFYDDTDSRFQLYRKTDTSSAWSNGSWDYSNILLDWGEAGAARPTSIYLLGAAGDSEIRLRQTGDTSDRFALLGDSSLNFGPGDGSTTDNKLSRLSATYMQFSDNLKVVGGTIQIGDDVNVYDGGTNILKTDDNLFVVGATIQFGSTGDVEFNRSTANEITTPDRLVANEVYVSTNGFRANGIAGVSFYSQDNTGGATGDFILSDLSGEANARYRVDNSGKTSFGPGSTGRDVGFERTAANTLKMLSGDYFGTIGDASYLLHGTTTKYMAAPAYAATWPFANAARFDGDLSGEEASVIEPTSTDNNYDFAMIPVYLPDGATVTALDVYGDMAAGAAGDCTVTLGHTNHSSYSRTTMAQCSLSKNVGADSCTDSTITDATVDTSTRKYVVRVSIKTDTSNEARFYSARITYTTNNVSMTQ
jgi:hypothetical protein